MLRALKTDYLEPRTGEVAHGVNLCKQEDLSLEPQQSFKMLNKVLSAYTPGAGRQK